MEEVSTAVLSMIDEIEVPFAEFVTSLNPRYDTVAVFNRVVASRTSPLVGSIQYNWEPK